MSKDLHKNAQMTTPTQGQLLKAWRVRRGMTQQKLAQELTRLGVPRAHWDICRWEQDRFPIPLREQEALAEILGLWQREQCELAEAVEDGVLRRARLRPHAVGERNRSVGWSEVQAECHRIANLTQTGLLRHGEVRFGHLLEVLALHEDKGREQQVNLATVLWYLGIYLVEQGDVLEALHRMRQGLELRQQTCGRDSRWFDWQRERLAIELSIQSRAARRYITRFEQLLQALQEAGLGQHHPVAGRRDLALAMMADDATSDAAGRLLAESIGRLEDGGNYNQHAITHNTMAQWQIAQGALDEAERSLRQALHTRPADTRVRVMLHLNGANLFHSRGENEEAARQVQLARGLCQTWGLERWLGAVERWEQALAAAQPARASKRAHR